MRGRPRGQVGTQLLNQSTPYPVQLNSQAVGGAYVDGFYGAGPTPLLGRNRRGYRKPTRYAWSQFSSSADGQPVNQTISNLQPCDLVLVTHQPANALTFPNNLGLLSGTDRVYYSWITTETSLAIGNGSGGSAAAILSVVVRGADPTVALSAAAYNVGVTPTDPRAIGIFMARGDYQGGQLGIPDGSVSGGGFTRLASGYGAGNMYNQFPKLLSMWNPQQGMKPTGTGSTFNFMYIQGGSLIAVTMLK